MRYTALAFGLLPLIVKGTNVVLSNDDGWAEINIRAFYNALTSGGDSVVISAPAENKSGTGMPDILCWGPCLKLDIQVHQMRLPRHSRCHANTTPVLLDLQLREIMLRCRASIM